MMKYVVALMVLIIVLVAYQTFGMRPAPAGVPQNEEAHETSETSEQHVADTWTFDDAGEKDGIPQTRVAVDVNGQFVPVGVFEGSCGDMAGSAWTMADGAIAGAICWFAGGGTEIAVFRAGDSYEVKAAILAEGTAEEGGFRGEFVTLLTI